MDIIINIIYSHLYLKFDCHYSGVGLNLTAGDVVIIFDPSWNPASDLYVLCFWRYNIFWTLIQGVSFELVCEWGSFGSKYGIFFEIVRSIKR